MFDGRNFPEGKNRWEDLHSIEASKRSDCNPEPTFTKNSERGTDWSELDRDAELYGLDKHTSPRIFYGLRRLKKTLNAPELTGQEQEQIRRETEELKKEAKNEVAHRNRNHRASWLDRCYPEPGDNINHGKGVQ